MSSLPCITVPSGYPGGITATSNSPSSVRVEWEAIPEIHRNGIITHYEVLFNQTSIARLRTSGSVNTSEMAAVVDSLQPFIPYTLSVRAHTRVGAGPLNPTPITVMTDPSGVCTRVC